MTRILLDAELKAKLLDLAQPLELGDESGRVLARVLPSFERSLYQNLDPEADDEELRRRRKDKGLTYSTGEVLGRLEQL